MHLFGLQGFKPMAVARVSGMRLLRVKRRDPSPASTIHYLRQAGALSAAIAKNMSGALNQPGGELSHTSSSASSLEDDGGTGLTSFMEAHAQYSFIAVVALMSLFLVITISATGLLLAFCRKKNAVFTAPEKSDADSQLEMDDIDSSDVEMCRGDKGECYYHLSDDDNDGDDDNDEGDADDDDDAIGRNGERIKKLSKRSRTFPQLRKILERRRGQGTEHCKDGKMSKAAEPLVGKDGSATGDSQTTDVQSTVAASTCTQQHQTCRPIKQQHQDGAALCQNGERAVICRNPNHQHYSRQHHNCLYNRPHYHHRNQKRGPRHHPPYPGCGSRLQRSHTIHYIPQTQRKHRPADGPAKCGVQIKVRDMETIMAGGEDNVEPAEVGTVQLHYIPNVSSSVRHAAADFGHAEDIFNESEANFSNLRLQVDNERDTQTTPSTDNDKNNNDSEVLQNFVELSETCIPNYDVLNGNYSSTDSRLLSDYLTCSTGFSPTNDCIFSRDKTHVPQATPQTALLEQAGPSHNHICPASETIIDHRRPVSKHLTTFHNLFRGGKTEPRITIPATSSKPPSTDLAPPNNRDQLSQKCISQHACILPPPQGGPSKRLIHYHGEAAEERRCWAEIQNQTEKINSQDMTNQRANDSRVTDVAAPACNCYSNAGDGKLCAAHSEYDTTAGAVFHNCDVLLPVRYDSTDNLLKLCPENSHRASASGSRDDGGAAGGDDEEDGDCNDGDTFIRAKTRENNNYSDEDDEDLTLTLLK